MKIGFVLMQPAPYRDDIIKNIVQRNSETDIWYLHDANWYHTEWNYTSSLSNVFYSQGNIKKTFWGELDTDFICRIEEKNYDMLVVNGIYPMTLLKLLMHRMRKKKPYIIFADTVEKRGPYILRKQLYKNAAGLVVSGEMSKRFFQSIGVEENKIHIGCYVYNNQDIYKKIVEYKTNKTNRRKQLGMNNDLFWFLFVGKLIPSRRTKNLLSAVAECKGKFGVLIIGDGPDYEEVSLYSSNYPNIISIPKVPIDQLHEYYALCDGYVHPGKEPYSLAEIEAAIAGMPIVSTSEVGAYMDVIEEEKNGRVVEIDDLNALKNAMLDISSGLYSEETCQIKQRELLKKLNPEFVAEDILKIIKEEIC